MRKPRLDLDLKPKMCDPGMCRYCYYEGEGNMICTHPRVLQDGGPIRVVSEWENTKEAGICRRLGSIARKQHTQEVR